MNSRFALAVHVLTYLALAGNEPTPSDSIAGSAGTHPVVVRRIMGSLRRAGLVSAQPGAGGGCSLALPAAEITLLDVYRAVEDRDLFGLHPRSPNPNCACGANIQPVLRGMCEAAESALEGVLSEMTVGHVADEISARVGEASCNGDDWRDHSAREDLRTNVASQ